MVKFGTGFIVRQVIWMFQCSKLLSLMHHQMIQQHIYRLNFLFSSLSELIWEMVVNSVKVNHCQVILLLNKYDATCIIVSSMSMSDFDFWTWLLHYRVFIIVVRCFHFIFYCCAEYDKENPRYFTRCEHEFHLACLLDWMERSETCPVCDQVGIIYFICCSYFMFLFSQGKKFFFRSWWSRKCTSRDNAY